jgi:hypothetical protein
MQFLIGYDPGSFPVDMSGGHTVLRELAKQLSISGQTVYVLGSLFNVAGTKLISPDEISKLDLNNLITVYPEGVKGNPYNSKHVVRWILYHTNPEVEYTWGADDVYFYFNDYFVSKENKDRKILNCFDFKLDLFYDKKLDRNGYCHIDRNCMRLSPDSSLVLKYDSEDLFHGHLTMGWEWLVDKLNTKKYFITYNVATYYSAIASMCGCISIILHDGIKEDNVKEKVIANKYGVAYGFEEVDESISNRELLKPYLNEVTNNSIRTIENFILYWDSELKNK